MILKGMPAPSYLSCMRVLLVSDLHGNAAALEAIQEPFDVCCCMGDLVEYGPDPAACVAWARQHARYIVRGNHDHGTAHDVETIGQAGFRYLTMATRRFTIKQLSEVDRQYLARLPLTQMFDLFGKRVLMVHASPRDAMDEYVPPQAEAWAPLVQSLRADYLFVGHTHLPFTAAIGRTTIINPGSLGLPRDGNPKARYAILEDGQLMFREVEYDLERTVSAIQRAPLEPLAQQMLSDVYRKGRLQSSSHSRES